MSSDSDFKFPAGWKASYAAEVDAHDAEVAAAFPNRHPVSDATQERAVVALRVYRDPVHGSSNPNTFAIGELAKNGDFETAFAVASRMTTGSSPIAHALAQVAKAAGEAGRTDVLDWVEAEPTASTYRFLNSVLAESRVVGLANSRTATAESVVTEIGRSLPPDSDYRLAAIRATTQRFGLDGLVALSDQTNFGQLSPQDLAAAAFGLAKGDEPVTVSEFARAASVDTVTAEAQLLSALVRNGDYPAARPLAENRWNANREVDSDTASALIRASIAERDIATVDRWLSVLSDEQVPSHMWGELVRSAADAGEVRLVRTWGLRYTSLPENDPEIRQEREFLVGGCASAAATHPGVWVENSYRDHVAAKHKHEAEVMRRSDLAFLQSGYQAPEGDVEAILRELNGN